MNKPNAIVAVVTRTKNRPLLLRRAIVSVLGQAYQNWIHIIVNDGGQRAPVEQLVDEYAEQYAARLLLVHNAQSLGMEAASNVGIGASQSTYIVIHDDDDSWHQDFLVKTLAAIEQWPGRDCRGAVSYSERIVEKIQGDRIVEVFRESFNGWMQTVDIYRLAASNTFPPISFLFRRDALEEIGGFDETLPVLGDWDFHLRFILRFDIALAKEHLAYYHHRVADDGTQYGNSVTAAAEKHVLFRSLLINRWIREDIRAGRLPVSCLVAMSSDFEYVKATVSGLDRMANHVRSLGMRFPFAQLRRLFGR